MAERNIIQHLRTNETNVKPSVSEIEYGEIAINYKKDEEKIFIKNDENELVTFVSEKEVAKKQDVISDLAIIRSNAAKGATALQSVPDEYITEMELINKNYATRVEIPSIDGLASEEYVNQEIAKIQNSSYDDTEIKNQLANKADKSELFSKSYNDLTDKPTIPSIEGLATESYVNQEVSAKANVSDLNNHKNDTNIHVTLEDKTKWNSIEQNAKDYADSLAVNYDVAGAAETAKTDAISTAATDATTKDNKVLSDSKSYVDTETNKLKQSIDLCATVKYVDAQVANAASGLGGIPQYIFKGAEEVVSRIITTRNHASLVIGAMSDLHTAGTDDSATSVKHACLAMNEINKLTQLDLVTVLGDICVDHMDSVNNPGFLYVRQQLDAIDKSVDVIHLEGNHDLDEVNTSADVRRQEYYTFIGANNVNVVTDFGNEFRNYGYKDFDNKRIRVIYLNTSDVAEEGMTTHLRISPEQFSWFVNTALDFSNKTGASDWQVVVLTHIPLNYTNSAIVNLLQVLQDYKGKKSGSITQNGTTINYNFTNCQQTFICHIHGHIHNYRTDWFGDVLSITVPNACFGRNNEYGTSSSYDDTVHELYGDVDKDGNQRTYRKVMATVEDTAFSVFVIDGRITNKVHVYNYGAGLHRIIDLTTKEIIEEEIDIEDGGLTPTGDFVNAVPLSTGVGGVDIYNGVGSKNDTYISSSTGGDSSRGGYVATGVMSYPVNAVYASEFFILGADLDTSDNYVRIGLFKEDGTVACLTATKIDEKFTVTKLGEEYYKVEPLYSTEGSGAGTPLIYTSYGSDSPIVGMRISLAGGGNNLYISMKNPIVEGLDGETVQWSAYTNLVPSSIDSNGDVFNGVGYKEGTRLNSSGSEATLARAICSGFIPYNGEDIRAYGARTENLEAGAYYVCFYTSNFGNIGVIPGREFSGSNPGLTSELVDDRMMLTVDASEITNTSWQEYIAEAKYVRISMSACSGQVFAVTLNEEMTL